jgi:hypothetical protein
LSSTFNRCRRGNKSGSERNPHLYFLLSPSPSLRLSLPLSIYLSLCEPARTSARERWEAARAKVTIAHLLAGLGQAQRRESDRDREGNELSRRKSNAPASKKKLPSQPPRLRPRGQTPSVASEPQRQNPGHH